MNNIYNNLSFFYDDLTYDVDYKSVSEFIIKKLNDNNHPNNIVLDAGCGTGTLTSLIAEAGYEVIGTDCSVGMLNCARSKTYGKNILFLNQSLTDLDLFGTVGAAVSTLDTLNHITSLKNLNAAIARISLFLEKNGLFICDFNTPYKHLYTMNSNCYVKENNDLFCVWQNYLRKDKKTVDIRMDIFSKSEDTWERYSEEIKEKAYTIDELMKLFKSNSFSVDAVYDGYSDKEPDDKTERWVFVLRKER